MMLQIFLRCPKVRIRRFAFDKREMEKFAGGIVNVDEERTMWPSVFKPLVGRTIHLHKLSF